MLQSHYIKCTSENGKISEHKKKCNKYLVVWINSVGYFKQVSSLFCAVCIDKAVSNRRENVNVQVCWRYWSSCRKQNIIGKSVKWYREMIKKVVWIKNQ